MSKTSSRNDLFRKVLCNSFTLVVCILSVLYLLNLGGGINELIPDNQMFVGNLDEVLAVLVAFLVLERRG